MNLPATLGNERWLALADTPDYASISDWMHSAAGHRVLQSMFTHSPYLTRLALSYPMLLHDALTQNPDTIVEALMQAVALPEKTENTHQELKKSLRACKHQTALLTAAMDIAGLWPLEKVTDALSKLAGRSLCVTIDALLLAAHARGDITLADTENPSQNSGIIVLGMGKLGGYELNYSSDIDLIIFFESGKLSYKGRSSEQQFMNRLAQDIVHIMQERTADGYVFRTDLRLRPDPASTPPAINTEAAYYYYESVGQNWERAAMIKARPVAGDQQAGERFLEGLAPFMWRRSLDFAAINDIHSIKRQMDSRRNRSISLRGHNVKLGTGGIREIEFYVQIHQLIWGGRELSLRTRSTCNTLDALLRFGLIDAEKRHTMREAYIFLRKLEHRLQMVNDEQTHTMPETDDGVLIIARFMGYPDITALEKDFMHHVQGVNGIYASSFKSAENLGDQGNLVFTGVTHDPDTLETLKSMGYAQPETVSEIIMGWHHGSCRATRTKRARELLTELMPLILKRLAETSNPDGALLKFHDFLKNLPAGVQLFSLFTMHPQLLGLIADILGSAPTLAERLSKSPELLDAVLYDDFYSALPDKGMLESQLAELLKTTRDFEDVMDRVRQFRNEKHFQAGTQFLKHMITASQAGVFLSDLAETTIGHTVRAVLQEFAYRHGSLTESQFSILALGKLGSREMTFSSDIDLVFIYYVPDEHVVSDGEKGIAASVYYNRLAQRLLNAITLMGRGGRLYEVDTRLRPSGAKGPLAVSMEALRRYFDESAWTFEYMALTKARPIAGDIKIHAQLKDLITNSIILYRNRHKLGEHVMDLRDRITKEFHTSNPWNIKYVAGGLMDVDFIAQYLLLRHAPGLTPPFPGNAPGIFRYLAESGKITRENAENLCAGEQFLSQIFHMLRLCTAGEFIEEPAPAGLKKLLCDTVNLPDFNAVKERLVAIEQELYAHYMSLVTHE